MHVRREESADEKKIMIYSWVYTSVLMRFWFHWLWPRARLANTQNLNLIKPFTVCKAANDMLGKQSRHICMLISPQCAACATHNWPAATSAKVSWINEQSIPIYRNKDSTSDLKFLCVLGETLTNSALKDWKKRNTEQNSVRWRKLGCSPQLKVMHHSDHSSDKELQHESGQNQRYPC